MKRALSALVFSVAFASSGVAFSGECNVIVNEAFGPPGQTASNPGSRFDSPAEVAQTRNEFRQRACEDKMLDRREQSELRKILGGKQAP